MKKLLATTAIAAALLVGAQSAKAAPVLTLTVTAAGATAAQCATASGGLGTFSAGSCAITSTTGGASFVNFSQYGAWSANVDIGQSNGTDPGLSLTEPSLWLDTHGASRTAGSSITISEVVTGYTTPLNLFPLETTVTGNADPSMQINVADYYSATNSSVAGDGTQLFSATWGPAVGGINGEAPGSGVVVNVDNTGTYSESWIETITKTSGETLTAASTTSELNAAVPSPTPLSLLGFGLVALAFVSRRRSFQN